MPNTPQARDILKKLLDGIGAQDWDAMVGLYAEDVVIHWPFALPTPVIIRGRAALKKILDEGWKIMKLRLSNIRVHETQDPDVVIAEYDYHGLVHATNQTFHTANILVLTVRNGLIVSTRGYHNHVIGAAAGGTLEQLIPLIDLNPAFEN